MNGKQFRRIRQSIRTPAELSLCYLLCAACAYDYNHLGNVQKPLPIARAIVESAA